jgi:hypothetical protein
MLLGFGGPAAEAAKAAGMKFTPEGKLVKEGALEARQLEAFADIYLRSRRGEVEGHA